MRETVQDVSFLSFMFQVLTEDIFDFVFSLQPLPACCAGPWAGGRLYSGQALGRLNTVWCPGSGAGGRVYWVQAVDWVLTGAGFIGTLVGADLQVSPSVLCTELCPPSL